MNATCEFAPGNVECVQTATPALELLGLTERYDDDLLALDAVDLAVPAGEFFGLLVAMAAR